jgi:predicted O-methyltransferase YrrM
MITIENRFLANINEASNLSGAQFHVHKGLSVVKMSELLAGGMKGYFDFIYVDGSHQAPDVLEDLVMAYQLLRVGGLLVCDDYLWRHKDGVLHEPKIAIDSFLNINRERMKVLAAPLYQLFVAKEK